MFPDLINAEVWIAKILQSSSTAYSTGAVEYTDCISAEG